MSVVQNQGWSRAGKQKKKITEINPKLWVNTFVSADVMKRNLPENLIFPFRNLSALLPCNEPPDSQCMSHPGNESHTPCYEEEGEDKQKPVQWRFKSLT